MIPTKELSIETVERIIKLIRENNTPWIVTINKFGANIKEMGWLIMENIIVDNERHQSIKREYSKQYAFKIKEMVQKDLLCFYGISTILGYLMPNPFYTYILNMYDLVWLCSIAYQPYWAI